MVQQRQKDVKTMVLKAAICSLAAVFVGVQVSAFAPPSAHCILTRRATTTLLLGPSTFPAFRNKPNTSHSNFIRHTTPLKQSSTALDATEENSENSFFAKCKRLPTTVQFVAVVAMYLIHLTVLMRHQIIFPVQLIPNSHGHFTSIGLDTLAGIVTIFAYIKAQRKTRLQEKSDTTTTKLPAIISKPNQLPWMLPPDNKRQRITSFIASVLLVQAYFFTGRFSLFWEDTLYNMSGLGWPLTMARHRSLCVLFGHLSWVAVGVLILKFIPRPPRFFGGTRPTDTKKVSEDNDDEESSTVADTRRNWKWFSSNVKSNWIWWTIGGYFVTSAVFDIADLLNHYILPSQVLETAQESVVTQLVNPENSDVAASLLGYIAPCLSAPWWEEILYRGFLLSTLTQAVGYPWAVFIQGIVFSAHHMSLSAALPLAVLGWTWAQIYTMSGNLFNVIFIHALWNSRVFLSSWLGL